MNNVKPLFEQFDYSGSLESSETALINDVQLQQAKAAAFAEGYAAGELATKSKLESESVFLEKIVSQFGRTVEGFQGQVTTDLCDALENCVRTILPAAAKNEFPAEVLSIVKEALGRRTQEAITVKVSPNNVEVLQNALADFVAAESIVIEAAPAINDLEVSAHWGASGFNLNLQEAIDETISYLGTASSKLRNEAAV